MRDLPLDRIPAAVPTIAFALGIALAPALINALTAAAGFAATFLLLAALRGRPRRRLGSAILFLAAGIAIADLDLTRRTSDLASLALHGSERFTTIRAPIERGWERREDFALLRARSFVVVDGAAEHAIDLPLRLTLWDEPAASERSTLVRAEGFLSCLEDGCRMSVKSSRLLSFEGRRSLWHPAEWNRGAAERVAELGRRSALAQRGAAQALALALGRGELLDDEVREAYRRGGTYHLLVFSGMQIALGASVLSWAFRRAGRPRAADWALLAIALVAPPFAGHEPSVSRASIMIGSYAASRLLGRPTPPANLLFVSALVRLAFEPAELTDPGFALTWGATGGLILIGGGLASRFTSPLARALAFGVGAELATTPLTALFFNQIVIGGSLITLLLSPLLSLMVALSAGACATSVVAPEVAVVLLESIGRLDRIAVAANLAIADTTGAARIVAAPSALIVCGSFLLALAAFLRFEGGAALAALLLLLPPVVSFTLERSRRAIEGFEMTVIDVGQGEAILLRRGAESVLVDGGGRRGDPAFGRRVIAPFLADHGVRRPDVVVMTHPDPDHCAGLVSVVELLGAGQVWLSSRHAKEPCAARLLDAARRRRIQVRLVDRRPPAAAGSLPLRILAAEPPFRKSFANNTSLTIALEVEGRRILLTGDVEKAAEFQLLEAAPGMLACDVLKIAHHGSASSTAAAFLRAARPRIAAISCGRQNSYGHPAAEVVRRLERAGARIYRTDLDGTTTFVLREGRIFVSPQIDTGIGAGSL